MDITKKNVCELAPYISSITGLASNSASPSDQWLIKFNTTFKFNDTDVQTAFMKIFPSVSSAKEYYDKHIKEEPTFVETALATLGALNYESKIYLQLNDLLLHNVTPCILASYGVGKGCKLSDLVDMLQKTGLNKVNAIERVKRSTEYELLLKYYRPSINIPIGRFTEEFPIQNDFRYEIILNEALSALTLSKWVRGGVSKQTSFLVVFQLAITLYSFYLAGIAHNDLHTGNIFIRKLKKPKIFIYQVEDKTYMFETDLVPIIYDFDRAFSKRLGENKLLEGRVCERSSQCSYLAPTKDFIKVSCYLPHEVQKQLKEIVSKNDKGKDLLLESYSHDCFLTTRERPDRPIRMAIPEKEYSKLFHEMTYIIPKLYELLPKFKLKTNDIVNLENIFVVSSKYFNSNYTVKETELLNARKSILETVSASRSRPKSPVIKIKSPIMKSPKKLKPCKVGQERNPTTGRCRKISGKVKSVKKAKSRPKSVKRVLKPCKPGQERNPTTGRCRKIRK